MRPASVAIALLLLAGPAAAQIIIIHPEGPPRDDVRVIDGDTFELGGEVIRLWGIDASERDQDCDVGASADEIIFALLGDLHHCEPIETDRNGWTIARCYMTGGEDIGAALIILGMALEDTFYSDGAYSDASELAEQLGATQLSRGECIPPWEWREQN